MPKPCQVYDRIYIILGVLGDTQCLGYLSVLVLYCVYDIVLLTAEYHTCSCYVISNRFHRQRKRNHCLFYVCVY